MNPTIPLILLPLVLAYWCHLAERQCCDYFTNRTLLRLQGFLLGAALMMLFL